MVGEEIDPPARCLAHPGGQAVVIRVHAGLQDNPYV